ncbi:hypothetical protein ACFX11_025556 [Malus domestica]
MIHRHLSHLRSLSTLSSSTSQTRHLLQCNKEIHRLSQLGRLTDARQVFERMPQRDSGSWNTMISGYIQNGHLNKAQELFDSFRDKNVRTWTILLSGYAKHGHAGEAQAVFESMPERNVVSWNAMITAYTQNGLLNSARDVFDQMPERNIVSWNSIITGYCRCGRINVARELFDQMEDRNIASWMVMVSGYVEIGEFHEALMVFLMMLRSSVRPDQAILVAALSAVMRLEKLELIESLRVLALKTGCESNVVVDTAILNAYTANGSLEDAVKFFMRMPQRNDYSCSTMIAAFSQCGRLDDAIALYEIDTEKGVGTQTAMVTAYAQNGRIHKARHIFDKIGNPTVVAWNAMVAGYAQNRMLEEAKDIFSKIPVPNAASWAALISGFVQNGQSKEALELFAELHRSGTVLPSHSNFTSALFACANINNVEMEKQIHSLAIKTRYQFNSFVGNGLISMYAKCKTTYISQASRIKRVRDTVSWVSESCTLDDAQKAFEQMPKRDVVSWSAIISAYEQAGQGDIAFKLFLEMLSRGLKPNQSTITSLLSACGYLGATKLGEQIHALIHKLGLDSCLFVCNALITMYFKCGSPNGLCIFQEMPDRDIVTWNAVLTGCAQNGSGKEAVEVFKQMETTGISPNEISFVALLCACSHAGLVDEGWAYFNSMSQHYGIMPLVYHYTCMVDLLGRAGLLSESEDLIQSMPVEPDSVIWEALLGACRIHRNTELGQRTAERLFQMGTRRSGTYVLLSNMYASKGMWEKVREVREMMKDRGVTKEPGFSWIQIKNKVHYFLMGDKAHDNIKEINLTVNELYKRFRATGYVPDTSFVLHDVAEEQKEDDLVYHSEKLAVAYGILQTPNGSPIQILKNLRICGDCHSFMKFVSSVAKRKIILRDGNRFHHFEDGLCSCGDYW